MGGGFALGAKLCRPDADVWTLYGDGSGGRGLLLTRSEDIPAVLDEAVRTARSGTPVLINVHLARTELRKGSISR